MRRIFYCLIILFLCFTISSCKKREVYYDFEGPQTVVGYQRVDLSDPISKPVNEADYILVDSRGIRFTDATTTSVVGSWMTKINEITDEEQVYRVFRSVDDLLQFEVKEVGTYYLYPKIKPGASVAEIKVVYEPLR